MVVVVITLIVECAKSTLGKTTVLDNIFFDGLI
jgi:hypothetical protein